MIKEVLKQQKKLKTSQTKGFCQIRSKAIALDNPYIQANPLNSYEWIIIDIDTNIDYWEDLPVKPNIIVMNKNNNKGHLYYKISAVHNNLSSSYKAIEYYNAVRYGLNTLLGGDIGFNQTLSKNPLATNHWRVIELHDKEYELSELAEYCELVPRYKLKELKHQDRAEVIGRNCAIFWTAKDLCKGLTDLDSILAICNQLNDFREPLQAKEVLSIAKSICRYNNKPQTKATKEWLTERAKKNNKKSQAVRKEKAQAKKDKAFILFANPKNKLQEIADKLELSLIQVKRYKAEFKKVSFTNQVVPPVTINRGGYNNRTATAIDNYLADNFSLYAEREDMEKIPINTINRLLE